MQFDQLCCYATLRGVGKQRYVNIKSQITQWTQRRGELTLETN